MLFTDFVPDPIIRYNVGFVMIFLTVQNIVVNLTIIARSPIKQIFLRFKRCRALQKAKKLPSLKESFKRSFTK